MEVKPNSVPSVETEVENSTNVEATSVSPNDAKPIVGCSASLPQIELDKQDRIKAFKDQIGLVSLALNGIIHKHKLSPHDITFLVVDHQYILCYDSEVLDKI